MTEEPKVDRRYIPTVEKALPMMLLKVAYKCPNCGGRAEWDFVTTEQTDHVTKKFSANLAAARWCKRCYGSQGKRILEPKVIFMPEDLFSRWASAGSKKAKKNAPSDQCVSEGWSTEKET